jgi:hypothetical protein
LSIKLDIVAPEGNVGSFESSENIAARTRFGVEKALWRSGKDIHAEFNKQVLAKNKTGRIYIRRTKGGARRRHQASAPGETPANRTGKYRKSFDFSVDGAHQLATGLEAVSNTRSGIYPFYLEDGTKRMKARPGLLNAIKSSERNIIRNLSTEIEDAI